jgi:hypothetical protein
MHLAQHYGLPTRLLDWTRNPLVALYFVVSDERSIGRDGCLWALSPTLLNDEQTGRPRFPTFHASILTEVITATFTGEHIAPAPTVFAFTAFQSDLRMLVQQSTFTMHQTKDDLRGLPSQQQVLHRFIIPAALKHRLENVLGAVGISHSSLFPDLGGFAQELKRTRFVEEP